MNRHFNLLADPAQKEEYELNITSSQSVALDAPGDVQAVWAEIIRANWALLCPSLMEYSYPGFTREEIWFLHRRARVVGLFDPKTKKEISFILTETGPEFGHEIVPAGTPLCCNSLGVRKQ